MECRVQQAWSSIVIAAGTAADMQSPSCTSHIGVRLRNSRHPKVSGLAPSLRALVELGLELDACVRADVGSLGHFHFQYHAGMQGHLPSGRTYFSLAAELFWAPSAALMRAFHAATTLLAWARKSSGMPLGAFVMDDHLCRTLPSPQAVRAALSMGKPSSTCGRVPVTAALQVPGLSELLSWEAWGCCQPVTTSWVEALRFDLTSTAVVGAEPQD